MPRPTGQLGYVSTYFETADSARLSNGAGLCPVGPGGLCSFFQAALERAPAVGWVVLLSAFSSKWVGNGLLRQLERQYPIVTVETLPPADVIVVLGELRYRRLPRACT